MYERTVVAASTRCSAISVLVCPCANSRKICVSRGVSTNGAAGGAGSGPDEAARTAAIKAACGEVGRAWRRLGVMVVRRVAWHVLDHLWEIEDRLP